MYPSQRHPVFARQSGTRKFGRTFERLDAHSAESLGNRDLGKANVDCRFRSSVSQWGVLGEAKRPAGILYMDLIFHQPKDCILSSATVLVTLLEDDYLQSQKSASDRRMMKPFSNGDSEGSLQLDNFGPKKITGELRTRMVTSRLSLTPNFNVFGNGGGGVGKDIEDVRTYSSRWIFEGKMVPGAKANPNGPGGSRYRTLRWDFTENDLDVSVHSNEFHTALAFIHQRKPCLLKVEISGKLKKKREELKSRLRFPPSHHKEQGEALTYIGLAGTEGYTTRLDSIANGLARDLEMRNYTEIPVQMADALPASFQELPAAKHSEQTQSLTPNSHEASLMVGNDGQTQGTSAPAPLAGLLDQNTPMSSMDALTVSLGRASVVFGGPAGVRQNIDQKPLLRRHEQDSGVVLDGSTINGQDSKILSQRRRRTSLGLFSGSVQEELILDGEVPRKANEIDRRGVALFPILMLVQFLLNFLEFFGQEPSLAGAGRERKGNEIHGREY